MTMHHHHHAPPQLTEGHAEFPQESGHLPHKVKACKQNSPGQTSQTLSYHHGHTGGLPSPGELYKSNNLSTMLLLILRLLGDLWTLWICSLKAVTCSFSAFLDLKQASALVPTPGKQLEETEKEQKDLPHSRQVQRKGERRKDPSCLSTRCEGALLQREGQRVRCPSTENRLWQGGRS